MHYRVEIAQLSRTAPCSSSIFPISFTSYMGTLILAHPVGFAPESTCAGDSGVNFFDNLLSYPRAQCRWRHSAESSAGLPSPSPSQRSRSDTSIRNASLQRPPKNIENEKIALLLTIKISCVVNIFHKSEMSALIVANGTKCYSVYRINFKNLVFLLKY